jgi:PAS domain S-box-containing protein
MNIDLLNATKKLKRQYKRDSIQNDIIYDNLVHFNNFLNCNNIDKNINQLLADETIAEKEKRLIELFPSINKNAEHEFDDALSSIEKTNVYFSIIPFHEYQWLKKVISITENIPICITISSAKKETFGFPLIYVNKQFEKTTGYNRNEIIGKNCKFLQPQVPIQEEETQYKLIKNCLGMGIPTSVIITNVKKSSIPFHNLISLKPVIDEDGNYLYSIGIQTEITTEPLNKIDMQNVVDLINILSKIKINIIN